MPPEKSTEMTMHRRALLLGCCKRRRIICSGQLRAQGTDHGTSHHHDLLGGISGNTKVVMSIGNYECTRDQD